MTPGGSTQWDAAPRADAASAARSAAVDALLVSSRVASLRSSATAVLVSVGGGSGSGGVDADGDGDANVDADDAARRSTFQRVAEAAGVEDAAAADATTTETILDEQVVVRLTGSGTGAGPGTPPIKMRVATVRLTKDDLKNKRRKRLLALVEPSVLVCVVAADASKSPQRMVKKAVASVMTAVRAFAVEAGCVVVVILTHATALAERIAAEADAVRGVLPALPDSKAPTPKDALRALEAELHAAAKFASARFHSFEFVAVPGGDEELPQTFLQAVSRARDALEADVAIPPSTVFHRDAPHGEAVCVPPPATTTPTTPQTKRSPPEADLPTTLALMAILLSVAGTLVALAASSSRPPPM